MTKTEGIYLTIVVPFKNQHSQLENTIKDIIEYTGRVDFRTQVILSDTHSSDGSLDMAKKYASEIEHIEFTEPKDRRKGKGQGVQDGLLAAKGKYVMFMDADSSTPISELDKLLPYVNDFDIIMGSRYIKSPTPYEPNYFKSLFTGIKSVMEVLIYGNAKNYAAKGKQGRLRQFISRGGNLAFTVLLNQSYIDQRCGFKLYRSGVAKILAGLQQIYGFGFDTEYLAIAQKYKFKIIEVPVEWYDSAATSTVDPVKDTLSSFEDIFKVQKNLLLGKYSKKYIKHKLGKNIEEIILNWRD